MVHRVGFCFCKFLFASLSSLIAGPKKYLYFFLLPCLLTFTLNQKQMPFMAAPAATVALTPAPAAAAAAAAAQEELDVEGGESKSKRPRKEKKKNVGGPKSQTPLYMVRKRVQHFC